MDLSKSLEALEAFFDEQLRRFRELKAAEAEIKALEEIIRLHERQEGSSSAPGPLANSESSSSLPLAVSTNGEDVPTSRPELQILGASGVTGNGSKSYNQPMDNANENGAFSPSQQLAIADLEHHHSGLASSNEGGADRALPQLRIVSTSRVTRKKPKSHNLLSMSDEEKEDVPGPEDISGLVYTHPVRGLIRVGDQDLGKRKRGMSSSPGARDEPPRHPKAKKAKGVPRNETRVTGKRKRDGSRPSEAAAEPPHCKKPRNMPGSEFPGSINRCYGEGLAFAITPEPEGRQAYFVDASVRYGCAAVGITWRGPGKDIDEWEGQGAEVPFTCQDSEEAEIFAIGKAMAIAAEQIEEARPLQGQSSRWQVVIIFSDSGGALKRLEMYNTDTRAGQFGAAQKPTEKPRFREVLDYTMTSAQALWRLGTRIEVQIVPGHSGVPGNVAADRLAYRTVKLMSERRNFASNITSKRQRKKRAGGEKSKKC